MHEHGWPCGGICPERGVCMGMSTQTGWPCGVTCPERGVCMGMRRWCVYRFLATDSWSILSWGGDAFSLFIIIVSMAIFLSWHRSMTNPCHLNQKHAPKVCVHGNEKVVCVLVLGHR